MSKPNGHAKNFAQTESGLIVPSHAMPAPGAKTPAPIAKDMTVAEFLQQHPNPHEFLTLLANEIAKFYTRAEMFAFINIMLANIPVIADHAVACQRLGISEADIEAHRQELRDQLQAEAEAKARDAAKEQIVQ